MRSRSDRVPGLALALLLAGCASEPTPAPVRFGAEFPPVPRPSSRGSLWVEGRGDFITDPVAHARGDVVTVLIRENQTARQTEATSLSQDTSAEAGVNALSGLPLPKAFPNGLPSGSVTSSRSFDASSQMSKDGSLAARVTAVVQDVLPNGCLVIEGARAVRVDEETKTLRVRGIARPQDITPDNTILSEDLAEASVSMEGSGPLTRNGSRGWFGSVVDFFWHHLWPF